MVISLLLLLLSLSSSVRSLSTVSISRAGNQTLVCALTHPSESNSSNYLNCTSFPLGRIQIPVNTSFPSFTGITGGNGSLCALTSSSSNSSAVVCWRFSTDGAGMEYKRIYKGPELQDLDSGDSRVCGITSTGGLECFKRPQEFSGTSIATSLAVGRDFVCGLSQSGQVQCSGSYSDVVSHVPAGNFTVVVAGSRHVCAVSTAGRIQCWGGNMAGKEPSGEFTSLASGDEGSCGLRRPNGTLACWGNQNGFLNLSESLRNTSFVSLQGKGSVFCGVTTANYSLYCWGRDGTLISSSNNDAVFEKVVPGPCRKSCPCGVLGGYGSYCSPGLMICRSCEGEETPLATPLPPPSQTVTTRDGGKWSKKLVAFLVIGCIGSLSLMIVACFLFFKRCKCQRSVSRVHDSGPMDDVNPPPPLEKKLSKIISMGSCLEEYSLQTLLLATDDFSEDHKIGNGSFGSVYIGTLPGGSEIAIKRAETSSASQNCIAAATTKHNQQQQDDQDSAFVNELEFMSRLNHKNLVRLLGFCEDSTERILVYEYMKNGSLSDHLYKLEMESSPILSSWPARIKLALDAARGIQYLHQFAVPPIIHRDIKSSNILVDETWTAKISDFGLSLIGPPDEESHLSLKVAGTVGYIDPEYYRLQRLTTKSDVYSFGVVLLELLSGYKAIHNNENGDPRNVVDIVVPYIVKDDIHRVLEPRVHPPTPVEIEAVAYVGYLAADCVKLEGTNRPTMTEIVNSLERALAACLAPPALSRSNSISSDEG